MRVLKRFDVITLLISSQINVLSYTKLNTAQKYIDFLIRANYVREISKGFYVLVIKSGPLSPMIVKQDKAKVLYDPNIKEQIKLTPKKNYGKDNKALILKSIKHLTKFTVSDVQEFTNLSYESSRTALKRLVNNGVIKQLKLEPKGKTRIAIYGWEKGVSNEI